MARIARTYTMTKGGNTVLVTVALDGRTRIDVQGEISFVEHNSAEEAIESTQAAIGPDVSIEETHEHTHEHWHVHTHAAKS